MVSDIAAGDGNIEKLFTVWCQKRKYIYVPRTIITSAVFTSFGDPDPDQHVFVSPGSGSVSQRFGSGSFPFLIKVLSSRLKTEDNVSSVKLLEKNMKNLSFIH